MAKKVKTRKVVARVVGAVPVASGNAVYWRVRMVAPYFPFHMDLTPLYSTVAEAEQAAERWKRRSVIIQITK